MCELPDDPYLTRFTRHERHLLLGAYAQKVRDQTWGKSSKGYDQLVEGTCRAAVDGVCSTFRAVGYGNPSLDEDGKIAFLLQRQFRAYRNEDPSEKHQKAIPFDLISAMCRRAESNPLFIRFHLLTMVAFFFAMRSCEYLNVSGSRRTRPIRLCDIVFLTKQNRVIPHSSPNLHRAASISLTFRFQKRDQRDDIITQSRTGHPVNCPVAAGAALVRRMLADGNKPDDPVYTFRNEKGKFSNLSSTSALHMLRDFIATVDPDLNLKPSEVGLHSLRSSAAMAMYLNKVPVYTIMLLGRWSSDAFLRYIRKQVQEFSNDVSTRMTRQGTYHHVAEPDRHDPRNHNPQSAAANSGMGSSGRDATHGSFSVWV
jgi:hypothetical protein